MRLKGEGRNGKLIIKLFIIDISTEANVQHEKKHECFMCLRFMCVEDDSKRKIAINKTLEFRV